MKSLFCISQRFPKYNVQHQKARLFHHYPSSSSSANNPLPNDKKNNSHPIKNNHFNFRFLHSSSHASRVTDFHVDDSSSANDPPNGSGSGNIMTFDDLFPSPLNSWWGYLLNVGVFRRFWIFSRMHRIPNNILMLEKDVSLKNVRDYRDVFKSTVVEAFNQVVLKHRFGKLEDFNEDMMTPNAYREMCKVFSNESEQIKGRRGYGNWESELEHLNWSWVGAFGKHSVNTSQGEEEEDVEELDRRERFKQLVLEKDFLLSDMLDGMGEFNFFGVSDVDDPQVLELGEEGDLYGLFAVDSMGLTAEAAECSVQGSGKKKEFLRMYETVTLVEVFMKRATGKAISRKIPLHVCFEKQVPVLKEETVDNSWYIVSFPYDKEDTGDFNREETILRETELFNSIMAKYHPTVFVEPKRRFYGGYGVAERKRGADQEGAVEGAAGKGGDVQENDGKDKKSKKGGNDAGEGGAEKSSERSGVNKDGGDDYDETESKKPKGN